MRRAIILNIHNVGIIVADDVICNRLRRKRKKNINKQDVVTDGGAEGVQIVPVAAQETLQDMENDDRPEKKKRKRNHGDPAKWKKNIRKLNRNSGKAYVSTSGKLVESKQFEAYECNCKNKCSEKVTIDERKKFFDLFWSSGSFDTQTAILGRSVHVRKKTDTKVAHDSKREYSRYYYMPCQGIDVKVCKNMFTKTLKIDSAKIHRALLKVSCGEVVDKRGRHTPHNKLSDERVNTVKNHILSFPAYTSHYSRKDNPNKKYLGADLNLSLMYRLYKEKMESDNVKDQSVSQSVYEKIFYKDFDLGFKTPHKDTCKVCDSYNIQKKAIESEPDSAEKKIKLNSVLANTELHHRKVDAARDEMKRDMESAKNGEYTVLTFDLEKTFSLPKVPTGIAYYKRQLSIYNLGVHDCATSKGTMHLWHECQGGRGPDEIGSCLMKYISDHPTKEKIVLWCDSCGGQNRNFKMVSLLMRLVQNPLNNIKEIEQRFPIPGHSFLPNDTDFGHIEKRMRRNEHIYVPQQLAEIIKGCRSKKQSFEVIEMKASDIITTDHLCAALTNRKECDGEKVEWLKIRSLRVRQSHPYVMDYKYSHNRDVEYHSITFSKRLKKKKSKTTETKSQSSKTQVPLHHLPLVTKYPNGKTLPAEKKADLQSMLQLVPPIYHGFYEGLFQLEARNIKENSDEVLNGDP